MKDELKRRKDGRLPNIMSAESHIKRAVRKLVERSKIMPNGCIEYTGYRNESGYGRLRFMGSKWLASRLTWFLAYGPIPAEMLVLHHCDNPACVNIDHLFLGTDKDNTADAITKGRIDPVARAKRRWELCPTISKN